MSARRLVVTFTGRPACAYVRGWGSRDLLTELRGRAPIWASSERAWVTQESTARDLCAVAESRGYRVLLEDRGAA